MGEQGEPCLVSSDPWVSPALAHYPSRSCSLRPPLFFSHLQSSNLLLPFSGRVLCSVTQSLEKLQVLNRKENWREP